MLSVEYIAGFMDGEASFIISSTGRRSPRAQISITNTDFDILRVIQYTFKLWGADCRIYKYKMKSIRHKDKHILLVQRQESIYIVSRILLPHLTLKHRQAEILIEFLEDRRRRDRRSYNHEKEDILYIEMRLLNKTGQLRRR